MGCSISCAACRMTKAYAVERFSNSYNMVYHSVTLNTADRRLAAVLQAMVQQAICSAGVTQCYGMEPLQGAAGAFQEAAASLS